MKRMSCLCLKVASSHKPKPIATCWGGGGETRGEGDHFLAHVLDETNETLPMGASYPS
jgi:hypothetical protein